MKRNNWAIVIGIDHYPDWPAATLKAAVRDAVEMRDWLLDQDGGAVEPAHIFTLLSPTPGSNPAVGSATFDNPTQVAVIDLIDQLAAQVNAGADRLFFYFAGHGLSNMGGPVGHDDAVAFADFSPQHPGNSLSTEHIFAHFGEMPFKDEFFFIDACRDMPWNGPKPNFGTFPTELLPDLSRQKPNQACMFATTPGSRAAEVGTAGNERGAFSSALIAGLRGDGAAKRFMPGLGQYQVLVGSLFPYLREVVKSQMLAAGTAAASIQVPQMNTTSGGLGQADPTIVSLPLKTIKPVELRVGVDPKDAPPPGRIVVKRDDREVAGEEWAQTPVHFRLPQREYRVTTVSDVYAQIPESVEVNLYAPAEQILSWRRKKPEARAKIVAPGPAPPWGAAGVRRFEKSQLAVSSSDPLAFIELRGSSGRVVAHGLGALAQTSVKPGFYRARLQVPHRRPMESLISLEAGETREFRLPAPRAKGPVVDELFHRGIAFPVKEGAVEVSELVGPMFAPRIGTVLGLAAVFSDFPDRFGGAGYHLSGLGLGKASLEETLDVLVALEGPSAEAAPVSMRVFLLDDHPPESSIPLTPLAKPSAARAQVALKSGAYWVALDLPKRSRMLLPIPIISDAITRIVVEVPAEGPATVTMYLSRPGLDLQLVRAVDLFERASMTGQFDSAVGLAKQLRRARWVDPIVLAVEGALRLRLRQLGRARRIAEGLTKALPQLSDGWALLALLQDQPLGAAGRESLDAGIPIVSETAIALNAAFERSDVQHPRRALLARVVAGSFPGSFWTAWQG